MSDDEDAPNSQDDANADAEVPEADAEASENELDGEDEELDEEETEKAPSLKDKIRSKLKLIIISGVALILIGGGSGLYFSGVLTPKDPSRVVMTLPGEPVMQVLPLLTVDLKPSPNRWRPFIRIILQVELQGKSAQVVFVAKETKILDAIQTYLRTLTVKDLAGEAGTERLRQNLINIIRNIIQPEHVVTVLYKEILIR